jgi:hypothetical protein
VPLPTPDSLSLSEAVTLVTDRCDCSEDEAKGALVRAGLDGRLKASASTPLSADPDPVRRAKHPVWTQQELRSDDWNGSIDWTAGTIGPFYFSVVIKRASIEAWLGTRWASQSTLPARKATDVRIREAITAVYDKAGRDGQKPPNVRQIAKPVQEVLGNQGFEASARHIEKLASENPFKARRRPPGATLKSEKNQQNS